MQDYGAYRVETMGSLATDYEFSAKPSLELRPNIAAPLLAPDMKPLDNIVHLQYI